MHLLGLRGVADILLSRVASNTGQIHRLGRIRILVGIKTSSMDRGHLVVLVTAKNLLVVLLIDLLVVLIIDLLVVLIIDLLVVLIIDLLVVLVIDLLVVLIIDLLVVLIITKDLLLLIQILGRDSVQLLLRDFRVKVVESITVLLGVQHGEDFLSRQHQVNSILPIIEGVPNKLITSQGMIACGAVVHITVASARTMLITRVHLVAIVVKCTPLQLINTGVAQGPGQPSQEAEKYNNILLK